MRVLLATHNTKRSGAEVAVGRLLERITGPMQMHVALPDNGSFATDLRACPGIRVHIVPTPAWFSGTKKKDWLRLLLAAPAVAAITWITAWRLTRVIRRENIDVVVCSSIKADIYGTLAAILTGRPLAWYVHDYVDHHYFPFWTRRLLVALAHFPALILCNSHASRRALRDVGVARRKLRVLYYLPGRDSAPGSNGPALREELGLGPGARLVLHIGRITPPKGQLDFVLAARRLADANPDAVFLVIGDSVFGRFDLDYRTRVLSEIEAANRPLQIRWLGARSDVDRLLSQSDVAVMNSLWPEGFGLVVAEAMWAGTPVVGTALGGTRELLLDKETGLVVPPGDVTALCEAIGSLLSDARLAAEVAAKARARIARIQAPQNVRRFVRLLTTLSARGRRTRR